MVIPRPRGRGPIEARPVRRDRCGSSSTIPRPRGRGPIEANLELLQDQKRAMIPRPRGRGPIEAR